MTTSTIERPRSAGPDSGLGGNWRVIVCNDNHNTFEHVAATLARVLPGVNLEQGHRLADQIHNSGQAIVWSGPPRAGRALLGRARRRRPDHGSARAGLSARALALALALACVGSIAIGAAPAAAEGILPSGFRDTVEIEDLKDPTAVRFAPDGGVFIAQKNGEILVLRRLRG